MNFSNTVKSINKLIGKIMNTVVKIKLQAFTQILFLKSFFPTFCYKLKLKKIILVNKITYINVQKYSFL